MSHWKRVLKKVASDLRGHVHKMGNVHIALAIGKRVMSRHCNACPYIVNQDLHELTLEYKVVTRTLQGHYKAGPRLWELKIGGNAMS